MRPSGPSSPGDDLVGVVPDPACRFAILDLVIVLACCAGTFWVGTTNKLVDSRQWYERRRPDEFASRVRHRTYVFNLLLGLGPACLPILCSQYLVRRRRSKPSVTEWGWLIMGIWAIGLLGNTLSVPSGRGFTAVSQDVQISVALLILLLLVVTGPATVLAQLVKPWGWWRRNTWSEWLALASTVSLSVILYFVLDLGDPGPIS